MVISQRRLATRKQREQQILAAAIQFFAEEGFEGQTRALAERIGMSHSALYRYFNSKEDLFERVYQTVYLGNWRPEWREWLTDRSSPLEERLNRFYQAYTDTIFTYQWVRIFIFAGLTGIPINERYIKVIETQLVRPLALELRHHARIASEAALTPMELELIWGLHGRIFSQAIDRWVLGSPAPAMPLLSDTIRSFMIGVPAMLAQAGQTG